jgi:hypothetical protein
MATTTSKDRVRELQRALYRAAKADPGRRFHALYDRVYRRDVLERAWGQVRANRGAAGIDRQTLAEVERYGVSRLLDELAADLKEGCWRPLPARREERRPLSIPTVRDRENRTHGSRWRREETGTSRQHRAELGASRRPYDEGPFRGSVCIVRERASGPMGRPSRRGRRASPRACGPHPRSGRRRSRPLPASASCRPLALRDDAGRRYLQPGYDSQPMPS